MDRVPLVAFLTTRVFLFVLVGASLQFWPLDVKPGQWQAFPDSPWLDGWARWDAGWYGSIAEHGYRYVPGEPSNVVFMPLYPMAARALAWPLEAFLPFTQAYFLAALLLSNLSFLGGLVVVHGLAKDMLGRRVADRAAWALALFPLSFFASAAYTEGPFLLLSASAFALAHRGRWTAACLVAGLASAMRVQGLVVGLGLFLQWWATTDRRPRGLLPFLLAPAGFSLVVLYMGVRFGDPLVFTHVQREHWNRAWGLQHLAEGVRSLFAPRDLESCLFASYILLLAAALPLTAMAWRRMGPGYGAYCLFSLVLAFGTGIESAGRYVSILFPLFAMAALAISGRCGLAWSLAALSVPFLGGLATLFARWGHVT